MPPKKAKSRRQTDVSDDSLAATDSTELQLAKIKAEQDEKDRQFKLEKLRLKVELEKLKQT
jgi:hypothetical protein